MRTVEARRDRGESTMMARHHATLGALAVLGGCALFHLPLASELALSGCTVGAALGPDIDEPGSTIAHLLEPITGVVAWFTKKLAGGHRMGTHSILAALVAGGGTYLCEQVSFGPGRPSLAIVPLAICLALAIRVLLPRLFRPGHIMAIIIGSALAWLAWHHGMDFAYLPLAVGAGWLLHLLGDVLTTGGTPLFWPVTKRHYHWAILHNTDSGRERVLGAVMFCGVMLLAWAVFGPALHQLDHHIAIAHWIRSSKKGGA